MGTAILTSLAALRCFEAREFLSGFCLTILKPVTLWTYFSMSSLPSAVNKPLQRWSWPASLLHQMRILLDESLLRKLGQALPEHTVQTVQKRGRSGLKNGKLLRQASGEFDVLITGDQNLEYQQDLSKLPIPVIVMVAATNRIDTLLPLVPEL